MHVAVAPGGGAGRRRAPATSRSTRPGSDLAFTLERRPHRRRGAVGEIADLRLGRGRPAACPPGATECVLVRPLPADPLGDGWLAAGDLLAFEVVDPGDARRATASWARRQQPWPPDAAGDAALPRAAAEPHRAGRPAHRRRAVRRPAARRRARALPRALAAARTRSQRAYPVGIDTSAGGDEVTVARGNLVPAHHGRLVDGPPGDLRRGARPGRVRDRCRPAVLARRPAPAGPALALASTERGARTGSRSPSRCRPASAVAASPWRRLLDAAPPASSRSSSTSRSTSRRCCASRPAPSGSRPPLGSTVSGRATRSAAARAATSPRTRCTLLEGNASRLGARPTRADPGVRVATRRRRPAAPTRRRSTSRAATRPRPSPPSPRRAVLPADHAAAAAREPARRSARRRRDVVRLVAAGHDRRRPRASTATRRAGAPRAGAARRRCACSAPRPRSCAGTPVGLLLALDVCAHAGRRPGALRRDVLGCCARAPTSSPGCSTARACSSARRSTSRRSSRRSPALPGVDAVEVARGAPPERPAGHACTT